MSVLHSAVTSVTHNIPSFLRKPAIALIGEQCYNVLVYDFDFTNVDCLKFALSKGLGLGIVLGGAIVKIPQIITIVKSRSARGLSFSAYVLETISYAIALAYSSRNHYSFSTYGENFFLTIQNVVITLLILYFSSPESAFARGGSPVFGQSRIAKIAAGLAITAVTGIVLSSETLCPLSLLSVLQAATLPLSLSSKAPQIMANYHARSTGNLSAFAVFNALLGCVARLFTTRQEVDDPLVFWGFAAAGILNAVLAAQMVLYWDAGSAEERISTRKSAPEPHDSIPLKTGLGMDEAGTPGRRWTRKLD